jgi:hypothetical protein
LPGHGGAVRHTHRWKRITAKNATDAAIDTTGQPVAPTTLDHLKAAIEQVSAPAKVIHSVRDSKILVSRFVGRFSY